jgi:hypothetical protein
MLQFVYMIWNFGSKHHFQHYFQQYCGSQFIKLGYCEKTTDILYMYVNDQLLVNIYYTSSVVDRDLSLGRVKAKTIKLVFVAIE